MLKEIVGSGLPAGAQNFMLAPWVVAMRLPIMAAEAQKETAWSGETMRAASEKMAAAFEGVVAAQLSLIGSTLTFWPQIMAGRSPSTIAQVAFEQAVGASLRPASRRVKANFRRLSRRSF